MTCTSVLFLTLLHIQNRSLITYSKMFTQMFITLSLHTNIKSSNTSTYFFVYTVVVVISGRSGIVSCRPAAGAAVSYQKPLKHLVAVAGNVLGPVQIGGSHIGHDRHSFSTLVSLVSTVSTFFTKDLLKLLARRHSVNNT